MSGLILLGSVYSAPATMADLAHMVRSLPRGATWGAAGIGRFQLGVNVAAMVMGGHVRVGLEDSIRYDWRKATPATNVMLIDRIVRLCDEIGRDVATPEEARAMLGLVRAKRSVAAAEARSG